ncbi:hypothetical protein PsYK624_089840 [Phanerochaete sordida]|uniref:Uncharacterized protein n=1 Tax=Phanerochaete sordida TaxID=48140 RepID=A0A9P3GDC5_9APHY|nr:hypothetical protein PsYK624_089840 [Phanerochaete sordida]
MFARLSNALSSPGFPSVILVVGNFSTGSSNASIKVRHFLPEDGAVERFGISGQSMTTFRYGGVIEQSRDHLGEVKIYTGDGESPIGFLDEIEARVRRLSDATSESNMEQGQMGDAEVVQRTTEIVRQAVFDAIRDRGRAPSSNATQTYPVYVIGIKRSRAGRIMGEPKSWVS